MKESIRNEYSRWLAEPQLPEDLREELMTLQADEKKLEDAFYRDLAFGTGGLRGVIGAGTNRMNLFTVAKASQGLADHVKASFPETKRSIAISYDSRIKSDEFARTAASVFAANGIRVHIYKELMPTPCLSYAVRYLGCAAGVMITASHNPARYNGYKVYGPDGCQITTKDADLIQAAIGRIRIFEDVQKMDYDEAMGAGCIKLIPDEVYDAYIREIRGQALLPESTPKDAAIVYSPLCGTGLKPVLRALAESGYSNITVVPEQEKPDGLFPTCPYPNPEIREAMETGIACAREKGADLFLATDPDCDRCGIAIRTKAGDYELLTGNETGLLLLDYICSRRTALGRMPEDPVFVKTIVTTDLAERIAAAYGVRTINVLTGFKFIGEQIGLLEAEGKQDSYICGFEESYGYLTGSYVRDKDGVNAAVMICEMFTWYAMQGKSLDERLAELYREYGYCGNFLHTYTFEGAEGAEQMRRIMEGFRKTEQELCGKQVVEKLDYLQGLYGLPKADVLRFVLADGVSLVIRPSGTEPKLKIYTSVRAEDRPAAEQLEGRLMEQLVLS